MGVIRETSGKTGGDATGWKRGQKGYGNGKPLAVDCDLGKLYGSKHDGGNQGDFPSGKLKDRFKGYKGVDGDGGTQ